MLGEWSSLAYQITQVTGDAYAGFSPREQFEKHGIGYVTSEKPVYASYRLGGLRGPS
jgi:hypothetical protein